MVRWLGALAVAVPVAVALAVAPGLAHARWGGSGGVPFGGSGFRSPSSNARLTNMRNTLHRAIYDLDRRPGVDGQRAFKYNLKANKPGFLSGKNTKLSGIINRVLNKTSSSKATRDEPDSTATREPNNDELTSKKYLAQAKGIKASFTASKGPGGKWTFVQSASGSKVAAWGKGKNPGGDGFWRKMSGKLFGVRRTFNQKGSLKQQEAYYKTGKSDRDVKVLTEKFGPGETTRTARSATLIDQ